VARDRPSSVEEGGAIRRTFIECERLIASRLGWLLRKVSAVERPMPEHAMEPVLTAVQIALTEGWRERGIEPDAIVARCGSGFAAAYVQGTLPLEDAIEVACRISRLIREGRGAGHMLALRCDADETERLRQASGLRFWLEADESEYKTLIGCGTDQLANIRAFLADRQIEHWSVASKIAPHTPLVEEWKSEFFRPLSGKATGSRRLPYYSAVGGEALHGDVGPAQLWRGVREPCVIRRPLQRAIADGCKTFVEISGHPMLGGLIRQRAKAMGKDVACLPTMRRQVAVRPVMDQTAGVLQRLGVSPAQKSRHQFGHSPGMSDSCRAAGAVADGWVESRAEAGSEKTG
jgi:acyl transferase domain-containing protein